MKINTTRFGALGVESNEVIVFAEGLIGLEACRRWVFMADAQSDAVAWMQCVDRPDVALAVVSPRRFIPDYQLRVPRRELEPLGLEAVRTAHLLVILSQTDGTATLNLKAPLVIDLDRRRGRQVVANGPVPVRFELATESPGLKKIA